MKKFGKFGFSRRNIEVICRRETEGEGIVVEEITARVTRERYLPSPSNCSERGANSFFLWDIVPSRLLILHV